jgi:putative protease
LQHLPELLAPAGDKEALLAALASGADAVYFGVERFNARRNAANFTLEGLSETCDLVHLAGARAYLTLNTIILPNELDEAVELARQAWYRGIDALIVQDLGLMSTLARVLPQLELHTSTQMNIHNSEGIRLLAGLGAKRITLARELALDELVALAAVAGELGVELEVFAHGALCICYSGQCLMSSMVGTRSANRGLCAQPCRLPYKLIDTSTGKTVNVEGDFPLSPADLNTIDLLDELVASGVASLKIEGRMKDSAYVATATATYRAALDAAASRRLSDAVTRRLGDAVTSPCSSGRPQVAPTLPLPSVAGRLLLPFCHLSQVGYYELVEVAV